MSRVDDALAYLGRIPQIRPYKVKQAATDSQQYPAKELDSALEMPGGQKTKNWRDAVRALVLLKIIYDSRGEAIKPFAQAQKEDAKKLDEPALQLQIKNFLNQKLTIQTGGSAVYHYEDERNGGNCMANVFFPLPPPGRTLFVARTGKWVEAPYESTRDKLHIAKFAEDPTINGIFSGGAADCTIVAFLYGGHGGGILKAAKMVHLTGGDLGYCDWTQLNRYNKSAGWGETGWNYEQPSAVIFNTRDEVRNKSDVFDQATTSGIRAKLRELGINSAKLVIHFARGNNQANFGVNKWGYFGQTTAPAPVQRTKYIPGRGYAT